MRCFWRSACVYCMGLHPQREAEARADADALGTKSLLFFYSTQTMTWSLTSSGKGKEYECVELSFLGRKEKIPRRIIHFSSGETMEEYSTDEEEEEEDGKKQRQLLSSSDTSLLTWGPYVWLQMWRAATSTFSACDFLGERMASLFGITSAKYQYAIDEYSRTKREKEEQEETVQLFEEQLSCENPTLETHQSESKIFQVQRTNELELQP
ncbi:hypothetical protein DNTS_011837 [Danionella cerebrum]|uniref:Protein FAM177A1 n=1 Tax=Danionella cerebrum TaxID=2873325 RepID=A0A553MWG9_9TELE|nr:hypothetical protein DNTS_011837 [Danionella translucida]